MKNLAFLALCCGFLGYSYEASLKTFLGDEKPFEELHPIHFLPIYALGAACLKLPYWVFPVLVILFEEVGFRIMMSFYGEEPWHYPDRYLKFGNCSVVSTTFFCSVMSIAKFVFGL